MALISNDVILPHNKPKRADHRLSRAGEIKLYKGRRSINVTKEEVDLFYAKGGLQVEANDFHPNEYCILSSPENTSALAKYNCVTKLLEPLVPLKRDVWGINPLNMEQRCAMDLLLRDEIKLVTFLGKAGTGKTLMALACALKKVFDEDSFRRIFVSRPIMPLGKDIGFLPGTKEEKLVHWMQPIFDNLDVLCDSGDNSGETKNWIMESGKVEMEAITYVRGRSLSNAFIIIDEAQNLTPHEMKTIISRAGHNTKIILTGDPWQIDHPKLNPEYNGLTYVVDRFKNHKIFGHMLLEKSERSELAALAADLL